MRKTDPLQDVKDIIANHRRYLELMGELERPLRVRGMTRSWIRVIYTIARSRRVTSVSMIASETSFKPSHVSRTLHELEQKGLVGWSVDETDRRYRVYRLTEHGQAALGFIERADIKRLESMTTLWWPAKARAVAALLAKLVRTMERGY